MKSSTVAALCEWDTVDVRRHLTVLIPYEHLAIQHLIVSKDVVKHLLVKILRWVLKCDLHASSFLLLEIDVSKGEVLNNAAVVSCYAITHGGSRFSLIPTASSSRSSKARCSALFVASSIMRIRSLVYIALSSCSKPRQKAYLPSQH